MTVDAGERRLVIDTEQVNAIYLVSLTWMPLQNLTTRLANDNEVLKLFPANEYPWALSLGDLDIVTHLLSSPAQFIHCVQRRQLVEDTSFKLHADEMDLLGYYLYNGMRFDLADFEGMHDVRPSEFSDDLDRWVFEKFDRGKDVAPLRGSTSDEFWKFVADTEYCGCEYATDCALALLDLGPDDRKQFMEMVAQAKQRSVQNNTLNSLSLLNKKGGNGVSFLTYNANLSRVRLLEQLWAFVLMKKYQMKCDVWIGFGRDSSSQNSVDVVSFVSELWTYDGEIERVVQERLGRR